MTLRDKLVKFLESLGVGSCHIDFYCTKICYDPCLDPIADSWEKEADLVIGLYWESIMLVARSAVQSSARIHGIDVCTCSVSHV